MDKLAHPDNTILFSAKKKRARKRHGGKLKGILLSKKSQFVKATSCMIPAAWHYGKGKAMETVKKLSSGQELG